MERLLLSSLVALLPSLAAAQASRLGSDGLLAAIDARSRDYGAIARQIWEFAEVGYQETKSSALLRAELERAGFRIESGVADIPTAFVATFGTGKPVIAILGEFDALPGLSQDAVPTRQILVEGGPGHGCGHHLFGTASAAAAIGVKDWLNQARSDWHDPLLRDAGGRGRRREDLSGSRRAVPRRRRGGRLAPG
jgi:aminobenzoyl-glutamate utilization protein B